MSDGIDMKEVSIVYLALKLNRQPVRFVCKIHQPFKQAIFKTQIKINSLDKGPREKENRVCAG